MKKNILIWFLGSLVLVIAGCNKKFLEEKQDLTGANEEVFKDPDFAAAYVGFVYSLFQHADNSVSMVNYQTNANGGFTDDYTQTTEELAGQTDYNRSWPQIAINQNHANQYFGQRLTSSVPNNVWTRMKQINIFLQEIDKHGLTPEVTAPLKGQMLFWRAWQYFELLRLYGGVPLVLVPQNPIVEDGDNSNEVQRSTSAETLAQIEKDLDEAITFLPGRWPAAHWGRITRGAAAALKGRALLTWASPLFNRNDDRGRWQKAYEANLAAKNMLEGDGFGLAPNWGNMWFSGNQTEGVLVTVFNNVDEDQTQRNNGWERAVRSKQVGGAGSISPTKQIVDAFPMADGYMPGDAAGDYDYDPKLFYKDRDPRFYLTFAYNGSVWPYGGQSNYKIWTYSWHNNAGAGTPNRFTETAGANSTGIYVRKATNPSASSNAGFELSGTDYMEIRFAEVILNLAECAIGIDNLGEGLDLIKMIRERAGVEVGDGSYGLGASAGNRDMMFAAVLNERKIELAYENKRFWDLRRWMLFNDDFGTCTRLGIAPLNGTRRTGMWIYVKNTDGTKYASDKVDPMVRGTDGTVPVIDRVTPAGLDDGEYLDSLYTHHFEIITRDNIDPTSPSNWKFTWYNQYYFFGLHQNILSGSPYLLQTKDWPDLNGGMGTFDPLQ